MLSSSKALGAVPAPAETAPPSGAAPLLSRSWLLLSQEDARGLYTGALSARESTARAECGVYGAPVIPSQSDRVPPPCSTGPVPNIPLSHPLLLEDVRVPSDTMCPATQ